MDLNYPKHKHPHGVENSPPNEYRIWVCEECGRIFLDSEIRRDAFTGAWGHTCKGNPARKGERCESHLEPYIPDVKALGLTHHQSSPVEIKGDREYGEANNISN